MSSRLRAVRIFTLTYEKPMFWSTSAPPVGHFWASRLRVVHFWASRLRAVHLLTNCHQPNTHSTCLTK